MSLMPASTAAAAAAAAAVAAAAETLQPTHIHLSLATFARSQVFHYPHRLFITRAAPADSTPSIIGRAKRLRRSGD